MPEKKHHPAPTCEPIWFGKLENITVFVADLRFSSTPTGAPHHADAAPVEPDPTEADRLVTFVARLRQGRAQSLADAKQENTERRKSATLLGQNLDGRKINSNPPAQWSQIAVSEPSTAKIENARTALASPSAILDDLDGSAESVAYSVTGKIRLKKRLTDTGGFGGVDDVPFCRFLVR